jgi:hypothetical protein
MRKLSISPVNFSRLMGRGPLAAGNVNIISKLNTVFTTLLYVDNTNIHLFLQRIFNDVTLEQVKGFFIHSILQSNKLEKMNDLLNNGASSYLKKNYFNDPLIETAKQLKLNP